VNIRIKTKIRYNGQEYSTPAELPADARAAYEKALRSGSGVVASKKVVINGQEFASESALPADRVLLDHLNETTVKEAKDSGCWLGFSVYPDTKMDEERMVAILRSYGPEQVLVNSAADWGRSDPLKTAKTGTAMLAGGFGADDVDRVLWRNPVAFYGQSGRLDLDGLDGSDGHEPVAVEASATFAGNSVLRGAPRER